MAKFLLILPHLQQRMGAPYLGQQYIAAALLAAGHEVLCLDLAALLWRGSEDDAVAKARTFGPDVIGMTLFTYNALAGYQLLARLRAEGLGRLYVAGGPHPTVLPSEVVAHGFDVAVVGEGEKVIVAIAEAVDAPRDLLGSIIDRVRHIPGCHTAHGAGPASGFIDDLDSLPLPHTSYPSFDPYLYSAQGHIGVGGMLTSRGCPARCTFCANYVTGRGYRFRSTEHIINEMIQLSRVTQINNFPFWDDAFTARRPRLQSLCKAILASEELAGATWTCITPGNMVRDFDLVMMREAGCLAVNFGIESGDYNILKVIQKGQRPEHVKAAVKAARAAGMMTIVNFMFGFPEEGVTELQNTLDFMHELAPYTNFFNNRGVLVPFPGTVIYDQHVANYDIAGWWLDPARVGDEPNLFAMGANESQTALEVDPTLALDYFRYATPVRDKIAECVRFKALHNQAAIAAMSRRYASSAPGSVVARSSAA